VINSNTSIKFSEDGSSKMTKRHPEFFFTDTLVAIQIEDTLFNVHKYHLNESEVFLDMFKMPKAGGNNPEEGSSPEHPIRIEGVSASDFAALLTVLYARQFSNNQLAPEASLIIPAFRLANMWNFSALRAYLLPLAEKNLGDVDKIALAGEFGIKNWLAPAHIHLVQREEPLTTAEAIKLPIDSVLLISRMRERYQAGNSKQDSMFQVGGYYCDQCSGFTTIEPCLCSPCAGCGTAGTVALKCHSRSALAQMALPYTDNVLEREVKKWVEKGCSFGS
ncbi:unnamed protein product, partial [Rhizoctonia solani]